MCCLGQPFTFPQTLAIHYVFLKASAEAENTPNAALPLHTLLLQRLFACSKTAVSLQSFFFLLRVPYGWIINTEISETKITSPLFFLLTILIFSITCNPRLSVNRWSIFVKFEKVGTITFKRSTFSV